jgi:hypothetical protein
MITFQTILIGLGGVDLEIGRVWKDGGFKVFESRLPSQQHLEA